MTNHERVLAVLLVGALGVGAVVATAAEAEVDPVKARHMTMEEIGDAMKTLGGIARNQVPFDAGVVSDKAGAIAERLEKAAALFPEGSDKGSIPSRAKAEVWTQREGFDKGMKDAHEAAVALQGVTEQAAFLPALGKLGGACQSCHETYRTPED